ncbi:unnamed protein product [Cochlearia groenlandica]
MGEYAFEEDVLEKIKFLEEKFDKLNQGLSIIISSLALQIAGIKVLKGYGYTYIRGDEICFINKKPCLVFVDRTNLISTNIGVTVTTQ